MFSFKNPLTAYSVMIGRGLLGARHRAGRKDNTANLYVRRHHLVRQRDK